MADVSNIKINGTTYSVKDSVARNAMGGPNVAATKAAMTGKTKVYVYTGSESGMTRGNWYYWNGSAWASGGVYQSTALQTDKTLTVSDMAADAKTVGDWKNTIDNKTNINVSEYYAGVIGSANTSTVSVDQNGICTWTYFINSSGNGAVYVYTPLGDYNNIKDINFHVNLSDCNTNSSFIFRISKGRSWAPTLEPIAVDSNMGISLSAKTPSYDRWINVGDLVASSQYDYTGATVYLLIEQQARSSENNRSIHVRISRDSTDAHTALSSKNANYAGISKSVVNGLTSPHFQSISYLRKVHVYNNPSTGMVDVSHGLGDIPYNTLVVRGLTPFGTVKTLKNKRLIGYAINHNGSEESDNFKNYDVVLTSDFNVEWGGAIAAYPLVEGLYDYGHIEFGSLSESTSVYVAVCNKNDYNPQNTKSINFSFVFYFVEDDYYSSNGLVLANEAHSSKNANWEKGLFVNRLIAPASYAYGQYIDCVDWSIEESTGDILINVQGNPSASGLTTEIVSFGNIPYYVVNNYVGRGAVLHIDIEDENYTGSDNTSWVINELNISTRTDWNPVRKPKRITYMQNGTAHGEVDIDSYVEYVEAETGNKPQNIYILFGIYKAVAVVNGSATANYPATTFRVKTYFTFKDSHVVATKVEGFDVNNYYTKDEVDEILSNPHYITCWGDSLTAGGGWTSTLQTLSGLTVYNGGTGGEKANTITARQGGDVMMVNNIVIPASNTESVLIASRSSDEGISTYFGEKVLPLLQGGGAHVNPVKLGNVEGTLSWTGSSYADTTGTWTFTRSTNGDAVSINRPTAIVTAFDRLRNNPLLMIIFMGQNGGYDDDLDKLVLMHKRMIDHSLAKRVLVLGLSSGTAAERSEYETRMTKEFGRYFLSLREYLSTPIYENGAIVSCYGLADQNLEVDPTFTYNGKTTLEEIALGMCPHQILADNVHYTDGTKTVIGNLVYKRCCELGIFS